MPKDGGWVGRRPNWLTSMVKALSGTPKHLYFLMRYPATTDSPMMATASSVLMLDSSWAPPAIVPQCRLDVNPAASCPVSAWDQVTNV